MKGTYRKSAETRRNDLWTEKTVFFTFFNNECTLNPVSDFPIGDHWMSMSGIVVCALTLFWNEIATEMM